MDKRKNLIERFLEDYKMEGVCNFVVTEDDETTDLLENVSPMIRRRLNLSTLPSVVDVVVNQFFPAPCKFSNYEFIENVASTISDIIVQNVGKNLTVGEQNSLTVYLINEFAEYLRDYHKTKCSRSLESNKSLMENVSPEIRRRLGNLNFDKISSELNDRFSPCDYNDVGEWVGDVCDFLKNIVVDKIEEDDVKVNPKQTDALYYYFVDAYGKLLVDYYKKKCNESNNLTEQISLELRRRLDLDRLKHVLDAIIDYEINTCSFDEVGEYVSEVCDMLKDVIIDNVEADTQLKKISPKDRDSLYYFLVDTFGEYLVNYYKKQCVKGLKESKKKIIVTESQYNRLFEQKKSKVEMFQDLINDKLEYIRGFCNKDLDAENYSGDVGFETCAELEIIDSIKVDEVNMMTGARTDMSGNMYDSTPSIYVKLTINYSSLRDRYDFDEITYDLKNILKNSTGKLPIVFDYRTNNINKIKE